jgi:hypothetical protein
MVVFVLQADKIGLQVVKSGAVIGGHCRVSVCEPQRVVDDALSHTECGLSTEKRTQYGKSLCADIA